MLGWRSVSVGLGFSSKWFVGDRVGLGWGSSGCYKMLGSLLEGPPHRIAADVQFQLLDNVAARAELLGPPLLHEGDYLALLRKKKNKQG